MKKHATVVINEQIFSLLEEHQLTLQEIRDLHRATIDTGLFAVQIARQYEQWRFHMKQKYHVQENAHV